MDTQTEEILVGYALDILDEDERQAFEIQISRDPTLRANVAAWRQHIHQLALGAPLVAPSPQVKQELLARVRAAKRPAVAASAQPNRWRSLAWGVTLALVMGLGGWNIALRNQNAALQAENVSLTDNIATERIARVRMTDQLAQAGQAMEFLAAKTTTARVLSGTESAPSAAGTMYMQPGNRSAVLIIDGLEPLPAGRTYQFWLARENGQPIPSNTFDVDANGHASLMIEANDAVNMFQQVMVTIEPAAGSSQPSDGAVVLSGNL
jgi:anti-sigma-K factor RskA